MSESGASIVNAVVATLHGARSILPTVETIERMALAARAIARRRAEIALIQCLAPEKLQELDRLLEVDPSIGQTRFHWLRSVPDALALRIWCTTDRTDCLPAQVRNRSEIADARIVWTVGSDDP